MSHVLTPAYAVLTVLAWLVTRTERGHAVLAGYLSYMVAGDLVLPPLDRVYQTSPRPLVGWPRVCLHLNTAITLGWQFLFAACCLHYFTRRRPTIAVGAWFAVWLVFVVGHTRLSSPARASIYLAVWWTSLIVCWLCIAWGIFRRRDLTPGLAHLTIIFFAAGDVGTLLLRMSTGLRDQWDLTRVSAILVVGAGVVAHAWWLVTHRRAKRMGA